MHQIVSLVESVARIIREGVREAFEGIKVVKTESGARRVAPDQVKCKHLIVIKGFLAGLLKHTVHACVHCCWVFVTTSNDCCRLALTILNDQG